MRKSIVLTGIILVLLSLSLPQSVAAATVGYVNFEVLFSAHPEYTSKNADLQEIASKLTAEFEEQIADIEDEQTRQQLATEYEDQLDEYADTLRVSIIQSLQTFIAMVADAKGISVVLPNNTIVYGGVDLTQIIIEEMYKAYGISVPSHLRSGN